MNISEVPCKSILTRSSGYLTTVCSHSINPYMGCGLGRSLCGVGCYVRSNGWVTRGREWGGFLEVKTNAAEVYGATCEGERRWAQRKNRPFSIFLSSSTEPWQPAEKKYRVTRRLLEAMCLHPPDELILQTHSCRILEDIETISTLNGRTRLRVHMSIETDCENLQGLPRHAFSVSERIGAVNTLAGAGICVVVCLAPLLPLHDPQQFFSDIKNAGARAVVVDHFMEGDGTPTGARTLKTELPAKMAAILPESTGLAYRNSIADIARQFLPTGISNSGFAGHYRTG